jgi:hypothetical protein
MELSRSHFEAINDAKRAQQRVLLERYPTLAGTLECVAVAGAFADLISHSSPAGVAKMLELVNEQIREAGAECRLLPRN